MYFMNQFSEQKDALPAEVCIKVTVSLEDVDSIMCSALENGIGYWCSKASVVGEFFGDEASQQIGRGGSLIIYDAESGEKLVLTLEKFLKGIEMYLCSPMYQGSVVYENGGARLNTYLLDAAVADMIVQYAIFSEVRYS